MIEFARAHKCFALLRLVMGMSKALGAAGQGSAEEARDKAFGDDCSAMARELGHLLDAEAKRLERTGAATLDSFGGADCVAFGGVDERCLPIQDAAFAIRLRRCAGRASADMRRVTDPDALNTLLQEAVLTPRSFEEMDGHWLGRHLAWVEQKADRSRDTWGELSKRGKMWLPSKRRSGFVENTIAEYMGTVSKLLPRAGHVDGGGGFREGTQLRSGKVLVGGATRSTSFAIGCDESATAINIRESCDEGRVTAVIAGGQHFSGDNQATVRARASTSSQRHCTDRSSYT